MIAALILGRGGSIGFPGKNTTKVLGRPMMEYAVLAAKDSEYVDEIYVSTDSEEIMEIAQKNEVSIIRRPDYLCTKEALHQDAMVHGCQYLKDIGKKIELIVLLQCNAPIVSSKQIDEGIRILREHPDYDSVATVSKYNMYSPIRARRIGGDGLIHSFISSEMIEEVDKITCDKDSQGDVYFTDGLFIVRPYCLEHIEDGMPPYRWMGQKAYPILNEGGLDVDYAWQVPQIEYILKENGYQNDV